MPELTRLDRTKSMMRYLPPNGTAGFARSLVNGKRRSPRPPAKTTPRTSTVFPPDWRDGLYRRAPGLSIYYGALPYSLVIVASRSASEGVVCSGGSRHTQLPSAVL